MDAKSTTSTESLPSRADFGAGMSTKAVPPQPPQGDLKPEQSQASRALGLASYFISGCMAINGSQVLGAPLYLINQEWYNAWIAFTKQSFGILSMTMTQWWAPTVVRISGDSTMRGQLIKTTDARLLCDFPQRMVLIANHQIYTDWLYLWWIAYTAGMHGRVYVVLKESLKRIPIIGWGMQFSQFIFLKRKWEQDKPRLAQHMQKFKNLLDPMWLILFPEGTNLADSTREASKQWAEKNGIRDMRHTLIPRSTGLQFMLQELGSSVEYVYDCTLAYEGVPRGQYAQDIFTVGASYFGGRPPKSVNMYWRRFRISSIPLDDDRQFELWLRSRWMEKDQFIETWYRTGRFPADTGSNKDFKGQTVHGAGHIETEIRPKYWYEFMQVFAPIGLFALVLYLFYGALPQEVVNKIKTIDQKTVLKHVDAIQKGELKIPETKDIVAQAPKHLQNQFDAVRKLAATKDMTPEKVVAQAQAPLPSSVVKPTTDVKPVVARKAPVKKTPVKKTPVLMAKGSAGKKALPKTKLPGNPTPKKLPGNPLPKTKLPGNPSPKEKLPGNPSPSGLEPVTAGGNIDRKLPQKEKTPLREVKQSKAQLAPSQTKTGLEKPEGKALPARSTKKPTSIPAPTVSSKPRIAKPRPIKKLQKPGVTAAPTASSKPNATSTPQKTASTVNVPKLSKGPTPGTKSTSTPQQMAPIAEPSQNGEQSENEVDTAELRHARKKLELRQGKQEPKRKTRRALEESGAKTVT